MKNPKKNFKPHYKTVKDARAVRTRQALRSALLLLLESRPLAQITILDICDRAGVGYTTYFRHHPTKESLLDDVAAEEIAHLVGLTLPLAEAANTLTAGVALFTYVDAHRELWSTLLTGGAEGAMRNEFLRISREIAATRGREDHWPPADLVTILVVSSTIELLSWWLRQKKPLSIEQMAEIHERIIIHPAIHMERIPAPRTIRRPTTKQ
jgi:AcrR family transcriptional regulator